MNKKTVAFLSAAFLISPVFIQPAANPLRQALSHFARASSTASSNLFHEQQPINPEHNIITPIPAASTGAARAFSQQQEVQAPFVPRATKYLTPRHTQTARSGQPNRLITAQTHQPGATQHLQELCRQGAHALALLNLQQITSGFNRTQDQPAPPLSAHQEGPKNEEEAINNTANTSGSLTDPWLQRLPTLSPSQLLALAFQAAPTQQKSCRVYTITPPALQPPCVVLGTGSTTPSEPTRAPVQNIVKKSSHVSNITPTEQATGLFLTDPDLMKAFEQLSHALAETCSFDGHTPLSISTEKITTPEATSLESANCNALAEPSGAAVTETTHDASTTVVPYSQPTATTQSADIHAASTPSTFEQTIKITLTAGSAAFTFFIAAKNLSSKKGLLRTLKTVEKAVRAGMPSAAPSATQPSASVPTIKPPVTFEQAIVQTKRPPTTMDTRFNTYTYKHPNTSSHRSTFNHLFENHSPFNHTQRRFSTNNPVVIEQPQLPSRLALEGPKNPILEPTPRPDRPSLAAQEQPPVSLPTRIHEPTVRAPETPQPIQRTQATGSVERLTPTQRQPIVTNQRNALVPSPARPTALVPSPARPTALVPSPARPTTLVRAPRTGQQTAPTVTRSLKSQPVTTTTPSVRPTPTPHSRASIVSSTPSSFVPLSHVRGRVYPVARPRVLGAMPAALLPTRPTPAPRTARPIIPPLHPVRPLFTPTPTPAPRPTPQPPQQPAPTPKQPDATTPAKELVSEDLYTTQEPTKTIEESTGKEGIEQTKKIQRLKEKDDTQKVLPDEKIDKNNINNLVKKSSANTANNMNPFEVHLQSSQPAKLVIVSGKDTKDAHRTSPKASADQNSTTQKNPVLSVRSGFNKGKASQNNTSATAVRSDNPTPTLEKVVISTPPQAPDAKRLKQTTEAPISEIKASCKTLDTSKNAQTHSSVIQSITNVLLQTVASWSALFAPVATMLWNAACTLVRAL